MWKHVLAFGRSATGGITLNLRAIVAPVTTSVPEQNLMKLDRMTSVDALRYLVNHRNTCASFVSEGLHFKLDIIRRAVGWL